AQTGYWRSLSTSCSRRRAHGEVGSVFGSKAPTLPPNISAEPRVAPQAAVLPVFFSISAFISVTDICHHRVGRKARAFARPQRRFAMAKRPTKAPLQPTAPADAPAPRKAGRPTSAKPRAKRAAAPPEQPQPAPAPEPTPQDEAPASMPDFMAFSAEQRQQLETLSLNLAKAAMMAQTAVAEAALSQADRPAALSPDPFNVAPAMSSVMTSLAGRPEKLFQAQADLFGRYMELWSTTTRRAMGETVDSPAPFDKRFRDPAWSENPMFDMMRQSYLATSDWMNSLVSSV